MTSPGLRLIISTLCHTRSDMLSVYMQCNAPSAEDARAAKEFSAARDASLRNRLHCSLQLDPPVVLREDPKSRSVLAVSKWREET